MAVATVHPAEPDPGLLRDPGLLGRLARHRAAHHARPQPQAGGGEHHGQYPGTCPTSSRSQHIARHLCILQSRFYYLVVHWILLYTLLCDGNSLLKNIQGK